MSELKGNKGILNILMDVSGEFFFNRRIAASWGCPGQFSSAEEDMKALKM